MVLTVKYIGCIGVKTSMRTLPHRTRSDVAKESINRLCEFNNIHRTTEKKRLENITRMLDTEPNLLHSGTYVHLSVTSTHLNVIAKDTQKIIIQHEMPNVSFASSGDEDTVDFVAYVAKDSKFGRACFVLECGYDFAKSVLESIARGFQTRTQQILYNTLGSNANSKSITCASNHDRFSTLNSSSTTTNTSNAATVRLIDFQDSALELPLGSKTSASLASIGGDIQSCKDVVELTRSMLEEEPWYHGSYLSREESETRLKHDGDFLVRESLLDPGHFVLSVMHDGTKLHLLFDSINQVRTREMVFNNISHLVKYHHNEGSPIVADKRIVYLLNGVKPHKEQSD